MRIGLIALAAVVLAVAAAPAAGAEPAKAAAVSFKGFKHCGNFPRDFTWGLRVRGVSCKQGKRVSERYYRATVRERDADVSFRGWRCTSRNYGDGGFVKCKSKRNRKKQVRFAMGG